MHLLPYGPDAASGLPTAPGWPHSDTAAGLAFAHDLTGAAAAWAWLIVDDDGRIAGECGVKGPPGPDGVVEIEYGLAGPSRGRGLGTRAVTALLEELRQHADVRLVEARVAVDNLASRRLLERLGFDLADLAGTEGVYRRVV